MHLMIHELVDQHISFTSVNGRVKWFKLGYECLELFIVSYTVKLSHFPELSACGSWDSKVFMLYMHVIPC